MEFMAINPSGRERYRSIFLGPGVSIININIILEDIENAILSIDPEPESRGDGMPFTGLSIGVAMHVQYPAPSNGASV